MKKYTQRELHNEAFRNMLANAGRGFVRGMGKVAKAVPGALLTAGKNSVKNIVKHISPELASVGRQALNIYRSGRPDIAIKDHLEKNRTVPVYMNTVSEAEIVAGTVSNILKDIPSRNEVKNSNTKRLKFGSADREDVIDDDTLKVPFTAYPSGRYIAYFDQLDKSKLQLIAIRDE